MIHDTDSIRLYHGFCVDRRRSVNALDPHDYKRFVRSRYA